MASDSDSDGKSGEPMCEGVKIWVNGRVKIRISDLF